MCVLSDWDVVEVAKNSGVVIKSEDNAKNFLQQHQHMQSIQSLKRNILENVEKQRESDKGIIWVFRMKLSKRLIIIVPLIRLSRMNLSLQRKRHT